MLKIRSLNQLALHNLRQYRLRTALSMAAVALGAAMVVAVDVMSNAMRAGVVSGESGGIADFMVSLVTVMFTLVGLVILAVAGFMVFNAFAMSIVQRRRQIGALRALGTTRRQIMRLVLVEAVVIGVLGVVVGLIVGPLLGTGIIWLMQKVGGQLFVFGAGSVSPSSLLLAAVLGIGVTLLSVLLPALGATRVPPLAALREQGAAGMDAIPIRRTAAGVILLAVIVVYLVIAPPGEWALPPTDALLLGLFMALWFVGWWLVLPGVVGVVGRWTRGPLTRRWGATGRLISDNLQRGRRRVMLTVLTLATGLTMIVGFTGMITFLFKIAAVETLQSAADARMHIVAPFDFNAGVAGFAGLSLDELKIPPDVAQDARQTFEGRAELIELRITFVPELAPMFAGLFSYVMDASALRNTGEALFQFSEGSWDTALPIMEAGCGVLVTPAVSGPTNTPLGGTLTVTGVNGPVDCTIAGIGSTAAGVSIISDTAAAEFDVADDPLYVMVVPHVTTDSKQLAADIDALTARHEGIYSTSADFVIDFQQTSADALAASMNGVLLLAILAAALGVVNTTFISVTERRLELGLFRAVGSTRRQVRAVITGEAALMGVIGGMLGLAAGIGLTVIFVTVYGGNGVGLIDLPLWPSAWKAVQPALITGIAGLLFAPLIAAGAAWLPARSILRGAPVSILKPGL